MYDISSSVTIRHLRTLFIVRKKKKTLIRKLRRNFRPFKYTHYEEKVLNPMTFIIIINTYFYSNIFLVRCRRVYFIKIIGVTTSLMSISNSDYFFCFSVFA